MTDNVVILDHYRHAYPGNGALQVLIQIISEYSDAVEYGQICDIADIIIGQLWVSGFKIVPLDEKDVLDAH